MIQVSRFTLSNGMRLVVNPTPYASVATFNLLYTVGSRNENPQRTGFAHLFEHLMFGGSANVPDFDHVVQMVGGYNNAYTTTDLTNYYISLPVDNIETAFWIDSDRMLSPSLSTESIETQRKVVVEEFRQRYLNKPYGDAMHHLRDLAYTTHPYRWPTIGLVPEHILDATEQEVRDFFYAHYIPRNAILSIVGDVDPMRMHDMAEKWFGDIRRDAPDSEIPVEPEQTAPRRREVSADVPSDRILIAFHKGGKKSADFDMSDLVTDILANGESSRFISKLVRDEALCSEANAFILSSFDPDLIVVCAQPMPGVEIETVEERIWKELEDLKVNGPSDYEVQKARNCHVSMDLFTQTNSETVASRLAQFEMLGDANLINNVVSAYDNFTPDDVREFMRRVCRVENSSTLVYRSNSKK